MAYFQRKCWFQGGYPLGTYPPQTFSPAASEEISLSQFEDAQIIPNLYSTDMRGALLSKNHIPMLQTCFKYPDVNPHQMVDAQLHLYPNTIHNLKSRWCLVPNGSIFCPSWSVEGSWPSISTFECLGTTFSCQLGIFHSDLKGTPLKESKHGHLGKKYSDWKPHYCWRSILIQPSKNRIPTSSCSWFRNPAFNQLIWRIYKLFRTGFLFLRWFFGISEPSTVALGSAQSINFPFRVWPRDGE